MAIITFYSNDLKETGQTLSLASIASYMAIEHNYKILIVSTSFNDLSLENCFWEYRKIRTSGAINSNNSVGVESGIEGLIKVLNSNRTSDEIVKNYSKTVLKDRLDVLIAPTAKAYQEYMETVASYIKILQTAKRYYDLIFVDLSKKIPREQINAILQLSDIVVNSFGQRLKSINDFINLRDNNDFYKRKNVMLLVGKYDANSKYNKKNISRYMKEKNLVSVVPYNTLLVEAGSEGTIIDFILKIRNVNDQSDNNNIFIKELKQIDNDFTMKMHELQMKI